MISIVMITMNEEKAIKTVVEDIKRNAPDEEILIVDSSKDETPQIAESLGVKVIRQFPPKGYGPAMDLALRSASGEVVVTLDCDDTYPAEVIPELTRRVLKDGYDLVDGSRLKTKPAAMPWLNYFANKGFAILASILFFRHITDLHSGMRAYRKSMIDNIKYNANGPALPVELLLKPIKYGFKTCVTYIDYKERIGVPKMEPLMSAWWTLKRILCVRFGN